MQKTERVLMACGILAVVASSLVYLSQDSTISLLSGATDETGYGDDGAAIALFLPVVIAAMCASALCVAVNRLADLSLAISIVVCAWFPLLGLAFGPAAALLMAAGGLVGLSLAVRRDRWVW